MTGTYLNPTTIVFPNGWETAPTILPATNISNFTFFVNGQYIEPTSIVSFTDGLTISTLIIDPSLLGYSFEADDVVLGIGKFN